MTDIDAPAHPEDGEHDHEVDPELLRLYIAMEEEGLSPEELRGLEGLR